MTSKFKITNVGTVDGQFFNSCMYEPEAGAPAGFIGVSFQDKPEELTFLRLSNIVTFSVAKEDLKLMWGLFETVPETVKMLRSI